LAGILPKSDKFAASTKVKKMLSYHNEASFGLSAVMFCDQPFQACFSPARRMYSGISASFSNSTTSHSF
jgi:hypothetical protein